MQNNQEEKKYGDWICADCGRKYGYPKIQISTYHKEQCDYCGQIKPVTEIRDWGYPVLPE